MNRKEKQSRTAQETLPRVQAESQKHADVCAQGREVHKKKKSNITNRLSKRAKNTWGY